MFVGSSSEGLEVANRLQMLLASNASVTIWSQGVFGLSLGTLETLVDQAANYDFAVLVLTPDDLLVTRGSEHAAPRDNVLFELGLFMGAIGKTRTFVLTSDAPNLKLPSDLAGITTARYPHDRADGNLLAALGPAATQISDRIRALGPRNPDSFKIRLKNSDFRVTKGSLFAYCAGQNTILLPANVYFDTTNEGNIVDERSTLGRRLAMFSAPADLGKFNADLDAEIASLSLPVDTLQANLVNKPGRQLPYVAGSSVLVDTTQGAVLLLALTGLDRTGTRYIASLNEEGLPSALRALWAGLVARPIRGDLFMPIVGSGFGGITRRTALTHILLSYRAAEVEAGTRLCYSLNVVVYHDDWGDGKWVRNLFEGLMS